MNFERLPIDKVELDKKNPRIAKWVEIYGGNITAEQLSLALGAGDSQVGENGTTFYSLKESIKTNGGIIHPIIVNKEGSGHLIIIEGNTRALIYREFKEQKIPGSWDTIPAMVYSNLEEYQIEAIRLQSHLVGPRAWDPYSKAKYLDYLRNARHLTMDQIVDFCGGRKKEVLAYISAYNDMETFYRPLLESDDEFDPTRFSAFVELQQSRIMEALLKTQFTKKDFSGWVIKDLLSPLNTIRQLPRILANPRSREIFLDKGAQEAIKVLDIPTPDAALKEATLEQLASEISRRIREISYGELQRLRGIIGSSETDVICDAKDQIVQLCSDIASSESTNG